MIWGFKNQPKSIFLRFGLNNTTTLGKKDFEFRLEVFMGGKRVGFERFLKVSRPGNDFGLFYSRNYMQKNEKNRFFSIFRAP